MAVWHNLKVKFWLSVAGLCDFNRTAFRTILPIASSMLTNFTTSYLSALHSLQRTWFHFLNIWLNLYGCSHYIHLPVIHNVLPEEENFHSVWHNFYCCIKIYRIKKRHDIACSLKATFRSGPQQYVRKFLTLNTLHMGDWDLKLIRSCGKYRHMKLCCCY